MSRKYDLKHRIQDNVLFPFQLLVLGEDGGAGSRGGVQSGQAGGRLVPTCRQILQVLFINCLQFHTNHLKNAKYAYTPGRSSGIIQIASNKNSSVVPLSKIISLATKVGPLNIILVANISSKFLRLLAMAQGALARQVTFAMTMMMLL